MEAAARILHKALNTTMLILVFTATALFAQDMLQGTVATVDPAAGRFSLRLDGGGTVTVQAPGRLPSLVAPGARLRVFGSHAGGGRFQAVRIEPVADPTGVRSRLQRRPRP